MYNPNGSMVEPKDIASIASRYRLSSVNLWMNQEVEPLRPPAPKLRKDYGRARN